ncbi:MULTISPECIES: GLPGLI family protein [unclassified Sphingobacterium]|uniref:GLPGLI family protein n=1 Tax=unclassified Sphingobacterium TaxID=2609468 RepID=UPI0025EF62ED|nr:MULTISPECIES: GLPGLI family protein [unclassified Sphingobacterium]
MNNRFVFLALLLCLLTVKCVQAQYAFFPENGTITYERKFHLHNYVKNQLKKSQNLGGYSGIYFDGLLKNSPAELITKNTLNFNTTETFFENVKEEFPANQRYLLQNQEYYSDTKTYSNFKTGTFKKLLSFGEDELQLADSIAEIKWKFTDEYRNILGYDCRRVNGVMQDSVYIVAFYTPQIPVSGGPELINGLPGMILGVAIPSYNLNYFATKVELSQVAVPTNVTKNKKAVPQTKAEISKKLKELMKWMGNKDLQRLFL